MELTSLPEPVRRYVESVLPEPRLPVRAVRVAQVGEMVLKPGARPLRFKAVEEFSVDTVAFTWRARFPLVAPIALRVTDHYQPPEGLLEVRLCAHALGRRIWRLRRLRRRPRAFSRRGPLGASRRAVHLLARHDYIDANALIMSSRGTGANPMHEFPCKTVELRERDREVVFACVLLA
jgi:hypothetical protein